MCFPQLIVHRESLSQLRVPHCEHLPGRGTGGKNVPCPISVLPSDTSRTRQFQTLHRPRAGPSRRRLRLATPGRGRQRVASLRGPLDVTSRGCMQWRRHHPSGRVRCPRPCWRLSRSKPSRSCTSQPSLSCTGAVGHNHAPWRVPRRGYPALRVWVAEQWLRFPPTWCPSRSASIEVSIMEMASCAGTSQALAVRER